MNTPNSLEWADDLFDDIRPTCDECEHPRCRSTVASAKQTIATKLAEAEEQAQIKGEIIGMRKAYRKAIMGAGEYHDDPYSYVVPIEHLHQYEADMREFDLTQPIFRDKSATLTNDKEDV